MKKYRNLIILLVVGGLLAFGLGFVSGFFNVFEVLGQAVKGLEGFFVNNLYKIYIVFIIIYLIAAYAFYFIGKNKVKEQLSNDEPIINDNYLSVSLGIGNVGYFISIVLFVLSISIDFYKLISYNPRLIIFLFVLFLLA